jgi:hypothetical protein
MLGVPQDPFQEAGLTDPFIWRNKGWTFLRRIRTCRPQGETFLLSPLRIPGPVIVRERHVAASCVSFARANMPLSIFRPNTSVAKRMLCRYPQNGSSFLIRSLPAVIESSHVFLCPNDAPCLRAPSMPATRFWQDFSVTRKWQGRLVVQGASPPDTVRAEAVDEPCVGRSKQDGSCKAMLVSHLGQVSFLDGKTENVGRMLGARKKLCALRASWSPQTKCPITIPRKQLPISLPLDCTLEPSRVIAFIPVMHEFLAKHL